MQKICNEQGGALVHMFANYVMALNTKVGDDTLASNWAMDGLKAVERWWLN